MGSLALQTTASTPNLGTERVRVEYAAPRAPALFVHKTCRQALDLPLSFRLTAVVLVTAVIALALLLQA